MYIYIYIYIYIHIYIYRQPLFIYTYDINEHKMNTKILICEISKQPFSKIFDGFSSFILGIVLARVALGITCLIKASFL